MSTAYVQSTYFTPKDNLPVGDVNKITRGAEIDVELAAISVNTGIKYDSGDLALTAENEAGTSGSKLTTPLGISQRITALIASKVQAETGGDNTVLMTPFRVNDVLLLHGLLPGGDPVFGHIEANSMELLTGPLTLTGTFDITGNTTQTGELSVDGDIKVAYSAGANEIALEDATLAYRNVLQYTATHLLYGHTSTPNQYQGTEHIFTTGNVKLDNSLQIWNPAGAIYEDVAYVLANKPTIGNTIRDTVLIANSQVAVQDTDLKMSNAYTMGWRDFADALDVGVLTFTIGDEFWLGNASYATVLQGLTVDITAATVTITGDTDITGDTTLTGAVSFSEDPTLAGAVHGYPRNYLADLQTTWATLDDVSVAAGECLDRTNTVKMVGPAWTKGIDSAWAAGDGTGGRSGALVANTWYAFFIIGKPDGTTDYGWDADPSGVNLLIAASGYTYIRRIAWHRTNVSSKILNYIQTGDTFDWDVPVRDVVDSTHSTTAKIHTLTLPPDASVIYSVQNGLTIGTYISLYYHIMTALAQTNTLPTATNHTSLIAQSFTSEPFTFSIHSNLQGSVTRQIRTRESLTLASNRNNIVSIGWRDFRGVR